MSQNSRHKGAFTDKRVRRGIKLDRVQASDFNNLELIYACEHCSFYNEADNECMMGMPTENHLKKNQLKLFNTTGHMAFCRFLEID